MENQKSILCYLKEFDGVKQDTIPPVLDRYIRHIAKTGETKYPWFSFKSFLLAKVNKIAEEFLENENRNAVVDRANLEKISLAELKNRVLDHLSQFSGTPFTIQRLCEVLCEPRKYYRRAVSFLHGIEKICLVVSTVDEEGNKIYAEDRRFSAAVGCASVNGSDCELWLSPDRPSTPPFSNDRPISPPFNGIPAGPRPGFLTPRPNLPSDRRVEISRDAIKGGLMPAYDDVDEDEPPQTEAARLLTSNKDGNNPATSRQAEQLTVTVTIPADAVNSAKLSGPGTSPSSRDLRPIGQLEAFVETVSQAAAEGNFVERLARLRADTEDEASGLEMSPAKRRRVEEDAVEENQVMETEPEQSNESTDDGGSSALPTDSPEHDIPEALSLRPEDSVGVEVNKSVSVEHETSAVRSKEESGEEESCTSQAQESGDSSGPSDDSVELCSDATVSPLESSEAGADQDPPIIAHETTSSKKDIDDETGERGL